MKPPPSSFDPTRVPSSPSTPNEQNVSNVLNTRPNYDRSNSQLGKYDSKRSSMISNASFQTAQMVPGSAYGGGTPCSFQLYSSTDSSLI